MNTTYLPSACNLDTWSASPWSDGLQLANLCALKPLGIYVGFSIEFHTDDGPIVTTRVREVAIVNLTALPS